MEKLQNDHHPHFESQGPKRMLHVVLLVFLLFFLICGIETLNIGISPSRTIARVNDTFEISCFVEKYEGKLDFHDGDDFVPESLIKRVNDSYIIYRNVCTKPTIKNITCKRGGHIIGLSEVYVEEKFGPVVDFKCRTEDLQNVTCSFKQASSNHIVGYRLHYILNNGEKNNCKLMKDLKGGYFCNITVDGVPSESIFNFTLQARSELYRRKQSFHVKLLETVLPKPIESVHVRLPSIKDTMSKNAFVILKFPKQLENIIQEMMFEVKVKPKDEAEWEEIIFSKYEKSNSNEKFLTLRNIKYSNTVYQLKFRMKTKLALDTDEMWTTYSVESFKTEPKLPERLPSVCEKCFNIIDNGNIYVYWTNVPKLYQNANNFSYLLRIYDPITKMLLNEAFVTKTSFMISFKIDIPFVVIHIYSSNQLGLSKNFTSIKVYVKKENNLLGIKKEWIDAATGYRLSWKFYNNIDDVESYTIIWCRQTNELPNQCDSSIGFSHLSSFVNEFYLNTTKSHQLGIAVKTFSGKGNGIQWAKCTSSKPDEIGVINSIWSKYVSENSISFEWKVNCADKDIVSAYRIQYCVVVDYEEKVCLEYENGESFNVTDGEQISNVYQITHLKPYKIYKISVSLISTSGRIGRPSIPILLRTLEGSPSAPQNLKAIEIKSNSVQLQWDRPIEVNGPSLTYQLWYNQKMIHIYSNDTTKETLEYQLDNLESFTNYTITVVACTRNCSKSSGSLSLRTNIGKPSRMSQMKIETNVNGSIEFSWHKPVHFGGHLDYYLLIVTEKSADETVDLFYKINGHRNSCIVTKLNCDKKDVFFSIRGVNINYSRLNIRNIYINDSNDCYAFKGHHNEVGHYYGDMSPRFEHICGLNYPSLLLLLHSSPIASIIIIIVLIVMIVVLCNFLYHMSVKFKDMSDIRVLLPIGIGSDTSFKFNNNNNDDNSVTSLGLIGAYGNLGKIKEESFNELELYENDLEASDRNSIQVKKSVSIGDSKEQFSPLISKSQTLDSKKTKKVENKSKSISMPSSPLKTGDCNDVYIEMRQPQKSLKNVSNKSVDGYLDMSKKSSNPYINHNQLLNKNDIKTFIENSQLNNGYIQRKSANISNGYVGFGR